MGGSYPDSSRGSGANTLTDKQDPGEQQLPPVEVSTASDLEGGWGGVVRAFSLYKTGSDFRYQIFS